MIIKLKIYFIAIFILCELSFAQNISPYSRFGIGLLPTQFSPVVGLQGGPGVGFIRRDFINNLNPATNAKTRFTIFNIGTIFSKTSLADANNSIDNLDDGYFNSVSIAVPIDVEKGITATASILPFSTVSDESSLKKIIGKHSVLESFKSSGGLSMAQIGISYSPIKNLYLGFSTEYLFGERNFNHSSSFTDTTFNEINTLTRYSESSIGVSFGFVYENLNQLLNINSVDNISIGGNLMMPRTLSSSKDFYTERSYFNDQDYFSQLFDTLSSNNNSNIPLKITLGTSVQIKNNLIALDYSIQDWSNFKNSNSSIEKFASDNRLSFGITTLPKESPNYLENITLSLGFSTRNTYLQISNQNISEQIFMVGTGFPLSATGKCQIGLTYTTRGKIENNLVKENIFGAFVNITLGELWFVQPPIE